MMIMGTLRLAAVIYQAGFQIDDFLTRVAIRLRSDHVGLGGVLQENRGGAEGLCSAMTLVDLASQSRFLISQDLGSQAEGCRLDTRGLVDMAAFLDRTLDPNLELLILNRFGKAETEGGGLRSAFVRAIDAGIPILTSVRPPYIEAWSEFHGGFAVDLPCDLDRVLAWCGNAVQELRVVRHAELSSTG